MLRSYISLAVFVCISLASIAACSQSVVLAEGAPASSTGFGSADSGSEGDGDASLPEEVPMCPVTTCTHPWETCPSSEFPCSTNLLSDNENCGGCGIHCPRADLGTKSSWTCVNGECSLICQQPWGDCDGDLTNGCETNITTAFNCGGCGIKCTDGTQCTDGACVDWCVYQGLPDKCDIPYFPEWPDFGSYSACVDLASDNEHCGACEIACDPVDPALPPLPDDMYYGCANGECGAPKCKYPFKADCNDNRADGCEAILHTDENCTDCNDTCSPGTSCRQPPGANSYFCAEIDSCARQDDPQNCGRCGYGCPGYRAPHFDAVCRRGICGGDCQYGYADCNELLADGCEVNMQVDNRNCGACGNACLPEQVCSQGKCQVAPCDGGVQGDPTK